MSVFALSIGLVVLGQIFNAGIVLIDKYIVTKTSVSDPKVYAFYVAIISGVVIFMIPFGIVHVPDIYTILLSLTIGLTFIVSIVLLFSSLKSAHATDVVAWLTAISTLTSFLIGSFYLNETLPVHFPYAILLFVLGMALVGHFRFHARSFFYVFLSGVLFGLSAVLVKVLFSYTDFADGFFWSRMGNVVGALSLLLYPGVRKAITTASKETTHKTSYLIVVNRILGGVAFLCILYAIRIGSVSIVNALSSLQFVFVFLLVFLLKRKIPEFYEHEFRKGHVLHKVCAMIFIVAGFFVLFFFCSDR